VCDKEVSTPPTIPVGPRSLQGVTNSRVIPDPVWKVVEVTAYCHRRHVFFCSSWWYVSRCCGDGQYAGELFLHAPVQLEGD
jgi:hypothetical protein